MKFFDVIFTVPLEELDPAQAAWYQHKPDQEWDHGLIVDVSEPLMDRSLSEAANPSTIGEQTISGDMPHPESDDDTLYNSHVMGLRLSEDSEYPQELNIARDVNLAEILLQHGYIN